VSLTTKQREEELMKEKVVTIGTKAATKNDNSKVSEKKG
jgi:hypothetical protein